ncbi:hypothetical protein NADFUDRAFT_48192 [Nadsonia fulvescens var. elongata DSM 6958]|uniref:Uncharacterized protein n=1 Tax=Nadsonia fulvescens var. elongata DSM 6958 TaxID=857566 RepID=A0A1E3PEE5_9ASCO|nr:hypothetical protein NADFUDRAFT_48192 [Nadsonia fulvescens var. elongata DSM 6958]
MVLYTKTNLYSIDDLIELRDSPLCVPPPSLNSSVITESIRVSAINSLPVGGKPPRKYVLPSRRNSNHTPSGYPEGQIHFNEALGKPDFETTDSPDISITEFANRFLKQRNASNLQRRSSMSSNATYNPQTKLNLASGRRTSNDSQAQAGSQTSQVDGNNSSSTPNEDGWVNVGSRHARKTSDSGSIPNASPPKADKSSKRRSSSASLDASLNQITQEWDFPNLKASGNSESFSLTSLNSGQQVKEFETWKTSMKQNDQNYRSYLILEEDENEEKASKRSEKINSASKDVDSSGTKSTKNTDGYKTETKGGGAAVSQVSTQSIYGQNSDLKATDNNISPSITQSVMLPRSHDLPLSPVSNPIYLHYPEDKHASIQHSSENNNLNAHQNMNIFDPHYIGTSLQSPADTLPGSVGFQNHMIYPPHNPNNQIPSPTGQHNGIPNTFIHPSYQQIPPNQYTMYPQPPPHMNYDQNHQLSDLMEYNHLPYMLPKEMVPRSASKSPNYSIHNQESPNTSARGGIMGNIGINLNMHSGSFDLRLHEGGIPMPLYHSNDPHGQYSVPHNIAIHPPQVLDPESIQVPDQVSHAQSSQEFANHAESQLPKGSQYHPSLSHPGWPFPVSPGMMYTHPPLAPFPPPLPPYGMNFNHSASSSPVIVPKPPYPAGEVNYLNEINFR